MNLMFISDIHILEKELLEINAILDEIISIKKENSIDKLIIAGDTFEKVNPTSKELDCFSKFIRKINLPIILLAANSHESTTPEESIINHFGILKDNVSVVKEYADKCKLFVGHFGLREAKKTLFGATRSIKEFEKFNWVILGHFHSFEKVGRNCIQLGAVRYVDFSEVNDKFKHIAICLKYESNNPEWQFLPLKSPYPMVDMVLEQKVVQKQEKQATQTTDKGKKAVSKPSGEGISPINKLITQLDKLDPNTKVRIILKDYVLWREYLPLQQKYKDKFFVYRERKDFILNLKINSSQKENNYSLRESLVRWMKQNKIENKIQKILLEEIK